VDTSTKHEFRDGIAELDVSAIDWPARTRWRALQSCAIERQAGQHELAARAGARPSFAAQQRHARAIDRAAVERAHDAAQLAAPAFHDALLTGATRGGGIRTSNLGERRTHVDVASQDRVRGHAQLHVAGKVVGVGGAHGHLHAAGHAGGEPAFVVGVRVDDRHRALHGAVATKEHLAPAEGDEGAGQRGVRPRMSHAAQQRRQRVLHAFAPADRPDDRPHRRNRHRRAHRRRRSHVHALERAAQA
jgi:hypothetical protein